MSDYYIYLWKVTWIETSGFLALCIFVLVRFAWKTWSLYQRDVDRWGKVALFLKGFGWISVLAAYLLMLYSTEPDWFSKPQWIQGEVQSKAMTQSSLHPYMVEVRADSTSQTLIVDGLSYRELTTGQRVKISYLPHRLEAVTCEILP